ncbi:hypothetical protein CEP52_008327 [Fusarium oligoseptatum]|uniref:Peptidase S8/S53 domain-containing protein n=1 Tax=Fusarium oligoseptatum TaxID=2604345 RepID=A0A428TIF0_9HYPO|nr:hypothetical protein CEP52_008327 [Fusarium oligoseptatum]
MICNKDENPVDSAKRLVQLVIESIDNSNEAESLALVNSRAALDFQLRLALLELDLGKDQTLPQKRSTVVRIRPFPPHLKTGSRHQGLQAALAHNSHDEAKSHKPFSTGLPETPQALAKLEKQLLGLRKPNSSRPAGSHHRATIREDPDVNKVDESESENERHNASTSETSLLRNGRATNCSVDHKVPATVECQDTINKKNYATTFMSQADTFYKERIRPLEAKAIKVAVLDTGVDEEEIHFEAVRGNDGTSIRATKSFVEGSPHDTHDTDGHGTKVAALVVSMAPHVDLYIAKVSKTKKYA